MIQILTTCITLCVLASTSLLAEVVHAPNLNIIQSKLNELDDQALVVFDVDFTLIVPKDQILQPAGEAYYQIFLTQLRAVNNSRLKAKAFS